MATGKQEASVASSKKGQSSSAQNEIVFQVNYFLPFKVHCFIAWTSRLELDMMTRDFCCDECPSSIQSILAQITCQSVFVNFGTWICDREQMSLVQADTHLRLKSFFRRRDVIFRRVFDLDLQCGTLSFLLQVRYI